MGLKWLPLVALPLGASIVASQSEAGPQKIMEAMASFPPKLSAAAEALAGPEKVFEEQASSMGVPVPQGPMGTLSQVLSNIESSLPVNAPQGISGLPPLPPMPNALMPLGIGKQEITERSSFVEARIPTPVRPSGESLGEAKELVIKEGTKKRVKEGIEIVEA